MRFLAARLDHASPLGLPLTLGAIGAVVFGAAFLEIAEGVLGPSVLGAVDPVAAGTVAAVRTPVLTRAFWVATLTGDGGVVLSLLVLAVGLFALWGRRSYEWLLALTMLGGYLPMQALKAAFGRVRPPQVEALIELPSSKSFPSGHAAMSLLFFGVLAFTALDGLRSRRAKSLALAGCLAGALAIGLSRVYLGVHFLTDVLASWCFGLAVLSVALGLFTGLRLSGRVPCSRRPVASRRTLVVFTVVSVVVAAIAILYGARTDPLLR